LLEDAKLIVKVAYELQQARSQWESEIKRIQAEGLKVGIKLDPKDVQNVIKAQIKAQIPASLSDKNILKNQITSFLKENINLSQDFKDRLVGIKTEIESTNKTKLGQLKKEFTEIKTEAASLGQTARTAFQEFTHNLNKVLTWSLLAGGVALALRSFKQAVQELKNIDTLLTEISKTSDMTASQLKKLGETSFGTANKYGATVEGYLEGVREMARAGFGDQSESMAEVSILAQSAGDLTADLANEYILATNAAYKLGGNEQKLTEILDGQNQVTNRNAVSMADLAEATKIAGAQAGFAGIEANELTAALGTMQATTQQGGSVVGRTFRALLMNIQGIKGEVADGDIIGEEDLSKAEKAAADLEVQFKYLEDGIWKLRDPMVVLEELADKFVALEEGDARGSALIAALGGKFRGTGVTALLSNWETYEKILAD
jgi:TP901 family phage tail tape measure protein